MGRLETLKTQRPKNQELFPQMTQSIESETNLPRRHRRRTALSLGLLLFSIYLLTYRGGFHSIDEVSMFSVTESLVKFGRFNTDQIAWTQWTTTQAEAQGFFGQDGRVYSKKGLALSLVQAPLYWLALHLPGLGMLQTVSLLNAMLTALTALLIFMFLQRLKFSVRTAVMVSLIFGLATISFVYAKYLFSEPLAGLLLLWAAYMLLVYRQAGRLRHVALAGLAAGFAVLTRANNLFLLPVFGLYLLWGICESTRGGSTEPQDRETAHRNSPVVAGSGTRLSIHLGNASLVLPLTIFVVAVALSGAILLGYNAIRSGNPFQTGYDLGLFSTNILLGLYKLLLTPLRGLFVYSPILLLSLPGWWLWRKTQPAEAWLSAGLVGVTVALFSAWSSGEGLSWGSRFLVPIVPFLSICLAPLIEHMSGIKYQLEKKKTSPYPSRTTHHTSHPIAYALRPTSYVLRTTSYVLLPLSCLIQLLGVAINPWVYLAQLQAGFGGEFFLENTPALYDFRYSQIAGQIQAWSLQNSDLAWQQPWGFDGLAFGLSLALVLVSGWLLWKNIALQPGGNGSEQPATPPGRFALPIQICLTVIIAYVLLARYFMTDRQFGPPDDAYTQALNAIAAQANPNDRIVTVAERNYHVPMNRFKARLPLAGFAQQDWPPPETALPLLKASTAGQNIWLVAIGFQPAAPNNAAEQWLARNAFKVNDQWFPDEVRLARYSANQPTITYPLKASLGTEVDLVEVKLLRTLEPGQILPVELTWLTRRRPQADYNLFLQLLSAEGRLVAQHDGPPHGGYTPTSTWSPGQQILDRHALALPLDLPRGDYRLIAGLYNLTTGERLSVNGTRDFVELGHISIVF